jgi:2-phospho-L-lactate transferase/gluconeogenesis factor (CofD/UPF0052 family)
MVHHGFPRAVVFGGGAGAHRVLTGLAAHLRGPERDRQHELLTVIVADAADVEAAESLVGHCACVLPAAADGGPVGRAHPDALRRIINADVIVAAEDADGCAWMPILGVGGIAATLAAVRVPRIFVARGQAVAPLLLIYRRPPRLASCFDRVLVDPGAEPDPLALARAILAVVRPLGTAPFAA